MNTEFILAVKNLKEAFYQLLVVYDKPHFGLLGCKDYPFVHSFDETYKYVEFWYESCVENEKINDVELAVLADQSELSEKHANKQAIKDLLFAYLNKDGDSPHYFEIEAVRNALPFVKGRVDESLYKRYEELIKPYI